MRCACPALLVLAPLFLDAPGSLRAQTGPPTPRALVWTAEVPGGDPAFAREVAGIVRAAGYAVEELDSAGLTNLTHLKPDSAALLVLPGAQTLPAPAIGPVEELLKRGVDLLALGVPGWQTPLFWLGGRWRSRAEYERVLAEQKPAASLIDFQHDDLRQWTRHANDPASAAFRELVAEAGSKALHVIVQNLTGWDTLASPPLGTALPTSTALTCFRAKGSPRTRQLALEWLEQDGSRWIATVALALEWQYYALPPEAFRPWQPPPGRGGPTDRVNLPRVRRFTIGLAQSHTALETGRHEYWCADIGMAPNPFGDAAPPSNPALPRLESFTPAYQAYPVSTPARVRRVGRDAPGASADFPAPPGLRALHPRPRGVGFNQNRPWRWQPLLAAYDQETGDYRGAIAVEVVHAARPFQGGVWGLFTPSEPAFYREPAVREVLEKTLARMRQGVFLLEGGSEFFTLFPGQAAPLGAKVANHGPNDAAGLGLRLVVAELNGGRVDFQRQWDVDLAPAETKSVAATWPPPAGAASDYIVNVELRQAGRVLDRLEHPLACWRPKARPVFIEARAGGFWLEGKPWKAHGVNYMPSSGIGVVNEYFEFWLDRGAYDPEVIERDLDRVRALGLNAVSVFVYHRSLAAQHLLDFLRRCERKGLRVNQSLRPGTPMDFRWKEMQALLEHYRLAQQDVIFAYDLAWEPSHYDQSFQQKHYTEPWRAWVGKRYGSSAAAAKSWGVIPPELAGADAEHLKELAALGVPPMRQLTQDGPWRKWVADYRAFLDDLLREKYSAARALVRSVDPHHPVSFRMQHAGDPTLNWEQMLPYDMSGLTEAVDIWEPEAYGRIGDWEKVKPGQFTAAYARLCDPSKPLVWAEMGYNVWDLNLMAPHPQRLASAEQFYRDFYRMLRDSGADGVFFWWFPGGFRVNENSDFGILNPDGTDRAVTKVIRAEGPRFLAAPKPPAPNYWIAVDRDRDARGLYGVYQQVQEAYWQATAAGRTVGLKWVKTPGSKSE